MQSNRTKLAEMSCPVCGFRVFNRRYPKCERCASDLPAWLVYSDRERRALLEREQERLGQELKQGELNRSRNASRRQRNASGRAVAPATPPTDSGTICASDAFGSDGGGVFDGGGASGSFGGDGGSSSSSD